jgi:hypothetical protein
MDPSPVPSGEAFVPVRDHELHAARAVPGERKIDRGPNPDRSV